MTNFIWPSDTARAENDELNRVCEYLEDVLDECDALAAALRDIRTAAAIFAPSFSREIERRTADPAALLARLKAEAKGELLSTARELDLTTNNGDVRRDAEWRAGWNQCIRELRRQAERTMEMNDNCPWRNRLDELLYQLAETIPNLNEPDYYKNELIDRLNELRRQAEENSNGR